MKDITIAYIGGGSRGWAWTFMTDLALEEEISCNRELVYEVGVIVARVFRPSNSLCAIK
jgi:hypothetical protein